MADETADKTTDGSSAEEPSQTEKTFTQAQVDAMILKRAERVAADKYGDYADLKKKADAHDEAIEAARTDQEKAVEKARADGRSEALSSANTRLVNAEARALAAAAHFRNPGLAVRAIDLSEVTVSDGGDVDAKAITAKLKELSEAEPYLVATETATATSPGALRSGARAEKGGETGKSRAAAALRDLRRNGT